MKKIYRILFTFILIYNFNYSWAHFGTRGGPTGGTVTCFYADNGNNLLYFGTKTGGVYYSRNTTFTGWTYVNYIGLESPYITAITSIGTTTTGVKMVAATPDKGLFVSSDKGITWTATYTGLANTNVTALITKDQYIIAGTGNGEVLISSDSAKTFIKSTSQPGSKINSLITDGNNIYAGTDNGVHISADNGLNWSVAGSGLSGQKVNALIINSGTILAGTNGGVYAATLSGINWSLTNTGLNSTTVTSFAVNGNNIYAGTNNGVFTSNDNGQTWTAANAGYNGNVSAVSSFNGFLYIGTEGNGIFRSSTSTISWTAFNAGFNNLIPYALYNAGPLVVASTEKGVFVSRNYATNYSRANTGLTDSLNVLALEFNNTKLYAGTKNGGVFLSSDSGKTWVAANAGLPSGVSVLKLIANNNLVFAALENGKLYSSSKSSISWTESTIPGTGNLITSLATDGINTLLAILGNGVFINSGNGEWVPYNTGLPNLSVTGLAINSKYVYAAVSGAGVYRSDITNCAAWSAVNTSLPSMNITALASAGKWVAAGYKGGVSLLTGNQDPWEQPETLEYLPSFTTVKAISFTPGTTDRIFVATENNSIYSNSNRELPGFSTVPGANTIAGNTIAYVCDGNVSALNELNGKINFILYPNPNNGVFRIKLPENGLGLFSFTIYSSSGAVIERGTISGLSELYFQTTLIPGVYQINLYNLDKKISLRFLVE